MEVKQKYVVADDMECPFCGGELDRDLLLSNPPQRRCSNCDKLVTVYL